MFSLLPGILCSIGFTCLFFLDKNPHAFQLVSFNHSFDGCEINTGAYYQPICASSNVAFLISAFLIGNNSPLAILYSSVLVLLAWSSLYMHAFQYQSMGIADADSMIVLFSLLVAFHAKRVLLTWAMLSTVSILVAKLAGFQWIVFRDQPVMYMPAIIPVQAVLIFIYVLCSVCFITRSGWFTLSVLFASVGFLFKLLSLPHLGLCSSSSPFQAHAAFHVFTAMATYTLFHVHV